MKFQLTTLGYLFVHITFMVSSENSFGCFLLGGGKLHGIN